MLLGFLVKSEIVSFSIILELYSLLAPLIKSIVDTVFPSILILALNNISFNLISCLLMSLLSYSIEYLGASSDLALV